MPLFRGIFLIIALWLALRLIQQLYHSRQRRRRQIDNQPSRTAAYAQTISCDHCRTHTPKTEAIQVDGRYFCSVDCRQQHRH